MVPFSSSSNCSSPTSADGCLMAWPCRLDWDPALALAGTSRAARDTVLAYHSVARVVLLELVPLVASAVASVSLQPQAGMWANHCAPQRTCGSFVRCFCNADQRSVAAAFAHCDDYIDRRDLRAALALPEENTRSTQPGGLAVEAGGELDLATKAEVLLDALTQQVSARKHQLQTEQLNWENLYEDNRVHSAVKRVVREVPSKHHPVRSSAFLCYRATTVIACVFGQNIVVRSYAKREVTSDEVITCILEVKVPTADATGGHDVFILNIVRRHSSFFCYLLHW